MDRLMPFTMIPFTPTPPNLTIDTMEEIAMSNATNTTTQSTNTATQKTKINWKVRLKNKLWLAAFASLFITFIYGLLELLDVVPSISEGRTIEIVQSVLTVLGLIGVVTDPTTAGIGDSERALGYEEPWNDTGDGDSDEDEYIGLTD